MSTTRSLRWALIGLVVLLSACPSKNDPPPNPPPGGGSSSSSSSSGGSSSGGSSSGGSSGGATATYLLYSSGPSFDDSIYGVDPAAPATPVSVDVGTTEIIVTSLFNGTLNPATQVLSDVHQRAAVYARTNGRLYKASTLKSGTPTPAQLSSETQATTLCDISSTSSLAAETETDFVDFNNSQIVYRLPGIDDDCGTVDDVFHMVRYGMSATDAPIAAKEPVVGILNVSTGAIAGWLVLDAGALRRCDANFVNCGVALMTGVTEATVLDGLRLDRFLLQLNNLVRVYDGASGVLSMPIFTLTSTTPDALTSDNNSLYFAETTGTGASAVSRIYRAPADGSAVATTVVTEMGSTGISRLLIVGSNLIYSTRTVSVSAIKSVAAAGGSGTSLLAASVPSSVFLLNVNMGTLYYILITGQDFLPTAGKMDATGGNRVDVPNSEWVGMALAPNIDLTMGSSGFSYTTALRADGYNASNTALGFANGSLRAVDLSTNVLTTLGTFPADLRFLFCGGFGSALLCEGQMNPFQTDIFYANASTAGSLVRVTNTVNRSEFPVE